MCESRLRYRRGDTIWFTLYGTHQAAGKVVRRLPHGSEEAYDVRAQGRLYLVRWNPEEQQYEGALR